MKSNKKVLEINKCNSCPHFKSTHINGDSFNYSASCNNPELDAPLGWYQQKGVWVEIPDRCPLLSPIDYIGLNSIADY